jgi:hypothetical protein
MKTYKQLKESISGENLYTVLKNYIHKQKNTLGDSKRIGITKSQLSTKIKDIIDKALEQYVKNASEYIYFVFYEKDADEIYINHAIFDFNITNKGIIEVGYKEPLLIKKLSKVGIKDLTNLDTDVTHYIEYKTKTPIDKIKSVTTNNKGFLSVQLYGNNDI